MKLGKVENWETEIRIDQDSGEKDEIWESGKLRNDDPHRPRQGGGERKLGESRKLGNGYPDQILKLTP